MNLHLTDNIELAPKFDGMLPDDTSLWTDRLVLSAVIWLSRKLDKPILKLTSRDYKDAGFEHKGIRCLAAYYYRMARRKAGYRKLYAAGTRTAISEKNNSFFASPRRRRDFHGWDYCAPG